MNNSKSEILKILNYAGECTGDAKGLAASECINKAIHYVENLIAKGFISKEIMDSIACQLPPKGATTINVEAIKMSSNGNQMTQGEAVMIR